MMRRHHPNPLADARTVARLRATMAEQSRGRHLDQDAALLATRYLGPAPAGVEPTDLELAPVRGAARSGAGRRRATGLVAAGVALAGAIAAIGIAVSRSRDDTSAPAAAGCRRTVQDTTLPIWAQAGFSPGALVNRFVTGTHGDIVGILFADALHSPPRAGQNNKILWVSRLPVTADRPLIIDAQLGDSGPVVMRTVAGGPGPSIIDLPQAGCWTLQLSWSGHHDTVQLPYVG